MCPPSSAVSCTLSGQPTFRLHHLYERLLGTEVEVQLIKDLAPPVGLNTLHLPSPLDAVRPYSKGVPSDPPLYRERYRPQLHYSPRQYWVNDPNGLVYVGGVFHLFYQHNPQADVPGHLSWGHATSPNLVHWTEHPVALPARESHVIYSGSVVTDSHHTSGLGSGKQPPLVALYTGHTDRHPARQHLDKPHHEAQYLAYSTDGGQTWQYGGETAVLDLNKADFRDPKVFWDEPRRRWVMLVVHPEEREVEFYTSPNLHQWTPRSTFGPTGQLEGIWEVPEFFVLPDPQGVNRWVLKVDFNPGGIYGGSGAQYWVGDFDGTTFTPLTPAQTLDFGKDFYAALSWSDLPGRRVWLAWMNNWEYATVLPTAPWRGTFTVPRELSLGSELQLVQRPVKELETLREASVPILPPHDQSTYPLSVLHAHELCLQVEVPTGAELHLEFLSAEGVEAQVTLSGLEISITRPDAHLNVPGFGGTHRAPHLEGQLQCDVHLLLDLGSLELFACNGQISLTDLLLPAAPIETLRISAHAGASVISGQLYRLTSIWEHK